MVTKVLDRLYHNNYTLHIIIKNFQGKGIWLSVRSLSSFNPDFKCARTFMKP